MNSRINHGSWHMFRYYDSLFETIFCFCGIFGNYDRYMHPINRDLCKNYIIRFVPARVLMAGVDQNLPSQQCIVVNCRISVYIIRWSLIYYLSQHSPSGSADDFSAQVCLLALLENCPNTFRAIKAVINKQRFYLLIENLYEYSIKRYHLYESA